MISLGIDIGTTSICAVLYDLTEDKIIKSLSVPNSFINTGSYLQDPDRIVSLAKELLKELLLGETKTGEELQKVFAASYYCMYAVTIAHGSERAAETAELLCEKIQRAKNEFSGVLICSLPTGILFLVLQKSFANGIVGAVKG